MREFALTNLTDKGLRPRVGHCVSVEQPFCRKVLATEMAAKLLLLLRLKVGGGRRGGLLLPVHWHQGGVEVLSHGQLGREGRGDDRSGRRRRRRRDLRKYLAGK
jgi:hypothetical protein